MLPWSYRTGRNRWAGDPARNVLGMATNLGVSCRAKLLLADLRMASTLSPTSKRFLRQIDRAAPNANQPRWRRTRFVGGAPATNPDRGRGKAESAKCSHCEETETSISIMGLIRWRLPCPTDCILLTVNGASAPRRCQRIEWLQTNVLQPSRLRGPLVATILLPRRSFDAATMHTTAVTFVRNIVGSLGRRTNDLGLMTHDRKLGDVGQPYISHQSFHWRGGCWVVDVVGR
jgi:hypothetical protein